MESTLHYETVEVHHSSSYGNIPIEEWLKDQLTPVKPYSKEEILEFIISDLPYDYLNNIEETTTYNDQNSKLYTEAVRFGRYELEHKYSEQAGVYEFIPNKTTPNLYRYIASYRPKVKSQKNLSSGFERTTIDDANTKYKLYQNLECRTGGQGYYTVVDKESFSIFEKQNLIFNGHVIGGFPSHARRMGM